LNTRYQRQPVNHCHAVNAGQGSETFQAGLAELFHRRTDKDEVRFPNLAGIQVFFPGQSNLRGQKVLWIEAWRRPKDVGQGIDHQPRTN
jgi:hypothetical protein